MGAPIINDGRVFHNIIEFYPKYFAYGSWAAEAAHIKRRINEESVRLQTQSLQFCVGVVAFAAWLDKLLAACLIDCMVNTAIGPMQFNYLNMNSVGSLEEATSAIMCLTPLRPASILGSALVLGELVASSAAIHDHALERKFIEAAYLVLRHQPTRKFIHGFRVCGQHMRLWMVDRSGAFCSHEFNTAERPDLVAQFLHSYLLMSQEDMGVNCFIRFDEGRRCVTLGDPGDERKLFLSKQPIRLPRREIGRATTVFAARSTPGGEEDCVVKFSWHTTDKQHPEHYFLDLAQRRKVSGVSRLVGYEVLGSMEEQRSGLKFRLDNCIPGTELDGLMQPSYMMKHMSDEKGYINREFVCIATAPLGRTINRFDTVDELLRAFCDILKGLKSLYLDGNMLHRDISVRNLIIPNKVAAGGDEEEIRLKGTIIDFKLAWSLDDGPTKENVSIGSAPFLALGLLHGQAQTYRHDIESLFYVFLWIAISNDKDNEEVAATRDRLPQDSLLRGWCNKDFDVMRQNKLRDMNADNFAKVLAEFSPEFEHLKDLASSLHNVLFSPDEKSGSINFDSNMDKRGAERLYDDMICTFDGAIHDWLVCPRSAVNEDLPMMEHLSIHDGVPSPPWIVPWFEQAMRRMGYAMVRSKDV